MRYAVHAEWTKLRTTRGPAWLLAATVAAVVAVGAASVASVDVSQCPAPTECHEDTTRLSLLGARLGQATVVVLAVLAITNEHATGMIRTTLAAVPRRHRVLWAKAVVVTVAVLAAGVLGVLGALATGRAVLPGNGFTAANGYPPPSLTDGPTLRAAVGTVLYLVLVALLALGVGTVVRDTAGAVTTTLGLLYVVPLLVELVADPQWHDRLERLAPMTAGLSVQATRDLDRLPIGPWAGLGVLAAYSATALLLGAVLLETRDP
ncbi:ABC transporter permease subunit [Wenjunlia vitaminophila]|uniref:ABC transporter permease subunit n=1 Tax=Wenjunlia vitaminophila TaxID=76728 RepID=UPI00036EA350|nr:ABC transporter permease subunit [Wenjunlia vitaminophila]